MPRQTEETFFVHSGQYRNYELLVVGAVSAMIAFVLFIVAGVESVLHGGTMLSLFGALLALLAAIVGVGFVCESAFGANRVLRITSWGVDYGAKRWGWNNLTSIRFKRPLDPSQQIATILVVPRGDTVSVSLTVLPLDRAQELQSRLTEHFDRNRIGTKVEAGVLFLG